MLGQIYIIIKFSGVLLITTHLANWPTASTILPAWFDHLVESVSYKEVLQFKYW